LHFAVCLFSVGYLISTSDLLDALCGGKPALQNIVIIGVDEKKFAAMGRWPWDRDNSRIYVMEQLQ